MQGLKCHAQSLKADTFPDGKPVKGTNPIPGWKMLGNVQDKTSLRALYHMEFTKENTVDVQVQSVIIV